MLFCGNLPKASWNINYTVTMYKTITSKHWKVLSLTYPRLCYILHWEDVWKRTGSLASLSLPCWQEKSYGICLLSQGKAIRARDTRSTHHEDTHWGTTHVNNISSLHLAILMKCEHLLQKLFLSDFLFQWPQTVAPRISPATIFRNKFFKKLKCHSFYHFPWSFDIGWNTD